MHHARIEYSDRLQRTLRVLQEADGEISTYELTRRAKICALSSVISELRENGAVITCRQVVENGQRRFFYTLIKSPELPNAPSKTD
jgi:hypothetical protein